MSLSLNNYTSTIHENQILKSASKCSNQCSFKYDYKTISTSLKGCIDQSGNNLIGIPAIELSSQNLSETSNAYSAIFNDTEYWVSGLYICKPGDNIFAYTNTLNRSLATDTNLSCLAIVHHDKYSNNHLVVYVPITMKSSNSSKGGQMLDRIIDKLYKAYSAESSGESTYICSDATAPTLSGQTLDINELIPSASYYYFKTKTTSHMALDMIVFSGQAPIYLSGSSKLSKLFPSTKTAKDISSSVRTKADITGIVKVFNSLTAPINSLTGTDEEIYIQCQPTNQEGELLEPGIPKDPTNGLTSLSLMGGDDPKKTMDNLFQDNMFVASVAGVVIMILLVKGAEFLMKAGTGKFLGEL